MPRGSVLTLPKADIAPATGNGHQSEQAVAVRPLNLQTALFRVEGITELVVHKWSEKAKRQMLEAQQNRVRRKKDRREPEQDYMEARYRLPDGRDAMPAAAFKGAIIGACRQGAGLTMTLAKTIIYVAGEGADQLIPIIGEPRMREDLVRNETGVADLRYRPGYWPWAVDLPVEYDADILSLADVANLVERAGRAGVGEWRPSAPKSLTGGFGMFRIARQ